MKQIKYDIFLSVSILILACSCSKKLNINSFTPVSNGAIASVDIDQDGKRDILHMGYTGVFNQNGYNLISEVHLKRGKGKYHKIEDHPFPSLHYATITETDFNNDGFSELLINGYTNKHKSTTQLFYSDGKGIWRASNSSFIGLHLSSVGILDIDKDGLLDIIMIGSNQDDVKTLVYRNLDGKNFKLENHSITPVSTGALIVDDINGDGYEDIIINGYSHLKPFTEVYLNEKGNFVKQAYNLTGSYWGGAGLINSSKHKVLILAGYNSTEKQIAEIYIFDKEKNEFNLIDSKDVSDNRHGYIITRDVNNDGNEDFFQFGQNSNKEINAALFVADDMGDFEKLPNQNFEGIISGFAEFLDFNGDGKLDIVYSGYNGDQISFYVYQNMNNVTFEQILHIKGN